MAASPATNPPIRAVANINKYGLSKFNINKETLCARMCSLLLLIQKLNIPHNRNSARNPVRKLIPVPCGIKAATRKATTAILHHGKYKQVAKLSNAVKINATTNFIYDYELRVMKSAVIMFDRLNIKFII